MFTEALKVLEEKETRLTDAEKMLKKQKTSNEARKTEIEKVKKGFSGIALAFL